MRSTDRDTNPSMISRVSKVFSVFTDAHPTRGILEISRLTGLPKSSVSRIVHEMVSYDFLEIVDGRVRLGIRCFEIGQLAQHPKELRRMALAAMSDLRQATGMTVQLSVLKGNDQVYLEILRGKDPNLVIASTVGGRVKAYATAGGKAILAFSSDEVVHEIISAGLTPVAPNTITDPGKLRAELQQIRETGVSFEYEESNPRITCVACPILRPDHTPIAAISLTGAVDQVDMRPFGPAIHAATLGLNRRVRATSGQLH